MPKPVTPRTKKAAAAAAAAKATVLPKAPPKPKKERERKTPEPKRDEVHHYPDNSTGPLGTNFIPTAMLVKMHNFVTYYLETGDSVGSLVKAGFCEESDSLQKKRGHAAGLLRNDYVKRILTEQYKAIIAKNEATTERIWQEISRCAFVDIAGAYRPGTTDPLPFSEMPEDVRRAITGFKVVHKTFGEDGESVEKEIKFAGKDGALDKLIRLHRMVDGDKMVILDGADFIKQMVEGRERASKREP